MSTVPRLVVVDRGYWVVDGPVRSHQALVVGRPVDLRGSTVPGVAVHCGRAHTQARVASGGQYVISGDADRVFPALATTADTVQVRLTAPGRPALVVDVAIPANAVLPVDTGDVVMPPIPVSVAGQVRRAALDQPPVAGARVAFVADPAVPALHPVALRTPLQSPHPATVTVHQVTVSAPVVSTTCPTGTRAGDHVVLLAAVAGVGAGSVLQFTPGTREHFGVVREVIGQSVALTAPLTASVPPGGQVHVVTTATAGPDRTLTADRERGDGLLLLDADPASGVQYVVLGGTGQVYALGALTDAQGFYRLGAVRGVAVVAVKASATGLASTQNPTAWLVDEHLDPNPLDLTILP
jgi:hypothetical protein